MRSELDNLREQADAKRYHLEQISRELKLAARLQKDFLPSVMPDVAGLTFHSYHRGMDHVSGDMFGVERLDENHVGVFLIDAVGHGMPAALLAMFLRHAVTPKIIVDDGYELLAPGDVLAKLNQSLCGQGLSHGFFATAMYAKACAETGAVELSRAGHPLPIHVGADAVQYVGGDGALLGVIKDECFEPATVELAVGDKLVMITDGAEAIFADSRYGDQDSWLAAVTRRRDATAAELVADIRQYCDDNEPEDDVTVVVIERS